MKKETPKSVLVWAVRALAAMGLAALVLFGGKGSYSGHKSGAGVALTSGALVAQASTLVVENTDDSGAGSLRDTIANASPGDTITFAPAVTGTITLTNGELDIDEDLTIQGPGANVLAISGNNTADHVFNIGSVTPAVNVTLSGLTITG